MYLATTALDQYWDKNKKILLVDTVSRTGKTLEKAKELLLLNSKNSKGLENSKNFQKKCQKYKNCLQDN